MLRYSFLAFAILGAMSVEASAQGVLTAGVYVRRTAVPWRLTVTDVPSGNAVVHFAQMYHDGPACPGAREDVVVSFDLPKNYAMDSPITGKGTCTVVYEPQGCNLTCSVPAQTWRFNQADPRTVVVTDEAGSRYTYKKPRGDKPLVNIEVKDVMKAPQGKKK